MSESKKGFPQKKKASDFIIYAVIAIVLAAGGGGCMGRLCFAGNSQYEGRGKFSKSIRPIRRLYEFE